MANAAEVTDISFKSDVLESDVPVLVDFWATWCAPCKMIAPIVEELATEYQGRIKVMKMDVDANPQVPGQFGVMSIPTLMLFRGGEPAQRIVGYQPKSSLKSKVEAVLAAS
jgi:thioredoxin 1